MHSQFSMIRPISQTHPFWKAWSRVAKQQSPTLCIRVQGSPWPGTRATAHSDISQGKLRFGWEPVSEQRLWGPLRGQRHEVWL